MSLFMSQSLADDPFAAPSTTSTRPSTSIRRSSKQDRISLPSPPTSDIEMDDGRPATPVMQTGRRKAPPPDWINSDRRTPSPKNVASRGRYAMDKEDQKDEDEDPFAAPKKNSRLYQGRGIKEPEGHVMTYVFRGKKVTLNQPLPTSDSEDEELPMAGPKFLFPQHAPDSPVASSAIQLSPKKPGTPSKNNSGIPPTPQSNIRRGNKRTYGHAPSDSITVLKDESDEEPNLFCTDSQLNKRARYSQQADFARRIGGGASTSGHGRVLFQ